VEHNSQHNDTACLISGCAAYHRKRADLNH